MQASVIAKAEKNQQRNEKNKKIKKTPDSVFNTVFINPDIYIYVSYATFLENDSLFFSLHVKLIMYKSPTTRLR